MGGEPDVRLRCVELTDGTAEIRFEIRGVILRRRTPDPEEGMMLCMEIQHALECCGVAFRSPEEGSPTP